MFETLERPGFLGQPARELRVTRADDLDGDKGAAALVEGLVDVGHTALTEESD